MSFFTKTKCGVFIKMTDLSDNYNFIPIFDKYVSCMGSIFPTNFIRM
jgi:hypothetical protein